MPSGESSEGFVNFFFWNPFNTAALYKGCLIFFSLPFWLAFTCIESQDAFLFGEKEIPNSGFAWFVLNSLSKKVIFSRIFPAISPLQILWKHKCQSTRLFGNTFKSHWKRWIKCINKYPTKGNLKEKKKARSAAFFFSSFQSVSSYSISPFLFKYFLFRFKSIPGGSPYIHLCGQIESIGIPTYYFRAILRKHTKFFWREIGPPRNLLATKPPPGIL